MPHHHHHVVPFYPTFRLNLILTGNARRVPWFRIFDTNRQINDHCVHCNHQLVNRSLSNPVFGTKSQIRKSELEDMTVAKLKTYALLENLHEIELTYLLDVIRDTRHHNQINIGYQYCTSCNAVFTSNITEHHTLLGITYRTENKCQQYQIEK